VDEERRSMTITDELFNAESAAETIVLAYDIETHKPDFIAILDEAGDIAQRVDKEYARALAVRLVELAQELPVPPRILRRASDIDDQLRGLEP
jgi:hypothetical protein